MFVEPGPVGGNEFLVVIEPSLNPWILASQTTRSSETVRRETCAAARVEKAGPEVLVGGVPQQEEDLAGEVTLETARDVTRGLALGRSSDGYSVDQVVTEVGSPAQWQAAQVPGGYSGTTG